MTDVPTQCVFCRLIREDATRWVIATPTVRVFAPRHPLSPGHMLVAPTTHHRDLLEVAPDHWLEVAETVRQLSIAMQHGLAAQGVDLLSANGRGSQQSVPHLHVHVVPRWSDDGLDTWPESRSSHTLSDDPVQLLAAAL